MTTYLVVVILLSLVYLAGVLLAHKYDRGAIAVLGGIVLIGIAAFLGFVMDYLFYGRQAFPSIAACEAKRMRALRQPLSVNVVCVPAYLPTKNDTLQINGIVKP